jgi:DNA polymerase-1
LATDPVPPVAEGERRLILIDGSGYIFRAFHALPPMTRPDGTHVNAVYGFTQLLSQFLAKHAASHIAVVFDASRSTFRNEIYAAYKAQRPEPPPELVPQFALVREATEALGVCQIEQQGYEADDMIAAYARAFTAGGGTVSIVSSDKDLMQLIGPGVEMLDPIKQKPIREPEVLEKFGVTPDKVVEVQALAGDSTDNVPGVPGIGVKTAAQLITEFGDLETLLASTARIKQPKRREALEQNAEQARISRRLVQLDADAPLTVPIEAMLARPPAPATLEKFLRENGFRSLLARLGFGDGAAVDRRYARATAEPAAPAAAPQDAPFGPYETVTTMDALRGWIAASRAAGTIGFDTETDSLDALKARLVGLSIATAPGRACYVPLRHEGSGDLMGSGAPEQIDAEAALAELKPMLEDPAILKVLHNAKYDLEVLCRPENGGIAVAPVDDSMMISYAMEAGRHGHGMDELALLHLGHQAVSFDSVTGTGRNRIPFSSVPLDKATAYAAEDADVTLRLWATPEAEAAGGKGAVALRAGGAPDGRRAARHGARRHQGGRRGARAHRRGFRPEARLLREDAARDGRPALQCRLAEAARGDPVRRDEAAGRQAQQADRRLGHRCLRAGGAGRRRASDRPARDRSTGRSRS